MSWDKVAKCDVCRQVKGEANKWLLVEEMPSRTVTGPIRLSIYFWDDTLATMPDIRMVCGESCLMKILQPFLDKR
jgi:hypothetical protein